MGVARKHQISLDHTPYYHCISRCVRRAFLCGRDRYTGRNFNHRKRWLEARLAEVSQVFAIDLLGYAIMSNHYHAIVRIDELRSKEWSDEEVANRWARLFRAPATVTAEHVRIWRERLASLSWYMRCINEALARHANREDDCTGRFWEGRFKCQALLDEAALVKCLVYVDLNPVRAGIAATPQASVHTSFKARSLGVDRHLAPFRNQVNAGIEPIPVSESDYSALLYWTAQHLPPHSAADIPGSKPVFLERKRIPASHWLREIRHYGRCYYRAVGSIHAMRAYCGHLGQNWLKGMAAVARAPA